MSFLAQGQGGRWLGGPEKRIRWHLHGEWAELGKASQAGYRGAECEGWSGWDMQGRKYEVEIGVSVASNA